MAIVVVQVANALNATGTNLDITATFAANTTAGNLIVAIVVYAGSNYSPAGSNMSDAGSDTFTYRTSFWSSTGAEGVALFDVASTAGGFTTVTYKGATTAQSFTTLIVVEVSGASATPYDTSATTDTLVGSTATNGVTSGSVTTTANGELVIGHFCDDGSANSTWAAGTSPQTFTIPTNGLAFSSGNVDSVLEHCVQASLGAINPTITCSTANRNLGLTATYKPSAGGAFDPTTVPWAFSAPPLPALSVVGF